MSEKLSITQIIYANLPFMLKESPMEDPKEVSHDKDMDGADVLTVTYDGKSYRVTVEEI